MAKSKTEFPTVYWDSCTFISWLDGGQGRTLEEMSGLNAVAGEINKESCSLLTSALTHVEVLFIDNDAPLERFDAFLNRRNNTVVVVDIPIAKKAGEIRTKYHRQDIKLSAEDSVHLATAIIYGASVFHTFDDQLLRL